MTMTHEPEDRFGNPAKLAGQNRLRLVAIGFSVAFLAITLQLANLTVLNGRGAQDDVLAEHQPRMPRPDIVDRNGVVIATDIAVASLYADPRKIIDVEEAVESLTATVPDLDAKTLRDLAFTAKSVTRSAWPSRSRRSTNSSVNRCAYSPRSASMSRIAPGVNRRFVIERNFVWRGRSM